MDTGAQYDEIIEGCKSIFLKKTQDYGTSWRILRPSSVTDQLFIKAQRIRTIEDTGTQKVDEGVEGEFMAIINYSVIGIIQLQLGAETQDDIDQDTAKNHYEKVIQEAKSLMEAKNHDYGEAWRDMRTSSMTDLILMKLNRIKQIEDNKGKTIASEGIDANYFDIINYAIFALIKMSESS